MAEQLRGFLHVTVHGGKQLPAGDVSLTRKGSSDPYCLLSFDGCQTYRTATIKETLDPVWNEAYSFKVGPFLPLGLLSFLGESVADDRSASGGGARGERNVLRFDVYDEDDYSADDFLGSCSLDVTSISAAPGRWIERELALDGQGGGHIIVSTCWIPGCLIPRYLLHVSSASCLSIAASLQLVSAFCRWAPSSASALYGHAAQPGVAFALGLGGCVSLCGAAAHFVIAHMERDNHLDDLVASHRASNRRNELQTATGRVEGGSGDALSLKVHVKARGLMNYEISLESLGDITRHVHLPVLVLGWLLPPATMGLSSLALLLQAVQSGSFSVNVGQLLAAASLACQGVSFLSFMQGEKRPRQMRAPPRPQVSASAAARGSGGGKSRQTPPKPIPEAPRTSLEDEEEEGLRSRLPSERSNSEKQEGYKWWWKRSTTTHY
eukprot:TRINITY_DN31012_c0_g1_i1.p1 TRINITY_DN31012_c0_g1~~TRINITY_DN31012_c0_g1_i1.p1  ORF type:complete len:437 (-),score=89.43 TRINITY_DN31012_c0_g1_i1:58-1368(-)